MQRGMAKTMEDLYDVLEQKGIENVENSFKDSENSFENAYYATQ